MNPKLFLIWRRNPNGIWENVEPKGHYDISLDEVQAEYMRTYGQDDLNGTEIVIAGQHGGGLRIFRIERPDPPVAARKIV